MDPIPPPANPPPRGFVRVIVDSIRSRIVSGLLFMLPIVITMWIIYWIYTTLKGLLLDPAARLVRRLAGLGSMNTLPEWWQTYVSPLIAILLALLLLYLLGYFVRTRFSRALDWIFLRVPGVTIVYKAVSNVFQSLQSSGGGPSFKRVVLVEFPHPGTRALAFVTKTMRDSGRDETILCVCVLTGVMPPSGFTLFVPESETIDVPWPVKDALQIILSGGITAPSLLPFHKGSPGGLILPVTPSTEDD